MQGEQPFAANEEAHFIFGMRVFGQEFGSHCRAVRMIGRDADDIDRLVSAFGLQQVDLLGIGGQNIVASFARRPAFEADANLAQR